MNSLHKPHVVVMMADQLRYDVINETYTPNLHRLREESVSFERAYCASPLCVPARGAFFTGMYPNCNGSLINPWEPLEARYGAVRAGTPNLYQMMEREWDSWHTGKQHFNLEGLQESASGTHWHTLEGHYSDFLKAHGKRPPGGPDFKGIVPEMAFGRLTRTKRYSIPKTGCYEEGLEYFYDGYIASTSIEAIRNRDQSKPLLLDAMFVAPHPPLDIPEPWYSMYADAPLPDNVGRWADGQSPLQLYNLTGAIGNRYDREEWQRIWNVYLGLVTLLDDCVGRLIDELKRQGIYEDTLLIFTSDHGEMLGSHRLYQKMCMYEESARVPLFMKFPSSEGLSGVRLEDPVSSVDVLPTLSDYLNLEGNPHFSGRSLMALLQGDRGGQERDIFIQFDGNGARGNFQRCVIRGARKLIVDLFKNELFLELYDVVQDRQEQRNLVFRAGNEAEVQSLLASLRAHMASTGDMLDIDEDAYTRFMDEYGPWAKRS